MQPTVLRLWAQWLRFNAQCQIHGTFRRRQADGTFHVCAIWALEEIADSDVTFLFSPLNEGKYMRQIVLMNDVRGWTFPQIADWLDLVADGVLSLREALAVRSYADMPAFYSAPYGPPDQHSLSYDPPDSSGGSDRECRDKRAPNGSRFSCSGR